MVDVGSSSFQTMLAPAGSFFFAKFKDKRDILLVRLCVLDKDPLLLTTASFKKPTVHPANAKMKCRVALLIQGPYCWKEIPTKGSCFEHCK